MRPLISTLRFSGIRLSSSVSRNSDSIISSGSTARDFGSMTTRMSSADSSRTPLPDIAAQWYFLFVQQLGDFFDQPGLLHQPGNFGNDHDPGAARAFLLAP